ncbi:hypothetical protein [Streptomyces hokutonensis]|uniref:hypothetical protein n=1 Tax=Streptomyces hokutonensis TaxID=1306990 RepID=UPI0033C43258
MRSALGTGAGAVSDRWAPAGPDGGETVEFCFGLAQAEGVDLRGRVRLTADESASWAQWAEAANVGDIALEQLLAETRALRDRVFALLEGHQYPRQGHVRGVV